MCVCVSHHGGQQRGSEPQRRHAVGRLGLGQQDGQVRGVVGLEHGPVVPGQRAREGLAGARDEEEGRAGVDAAVLQAQVGVQVEGEALELGAQKAVLIGLREREERRG